ncbi:DUF4153 domain-containing protein [Bordetella sp. N]|uniref:DUF4153 domain-containing protein n=1 Tax=Bordetella sp. N TaxID=1746199 RepID=UPI00070CD4FF|nr:DUF4153 domain-containing protein [Bordetella sp. N]ALM84056.1 hypothetical protein ASB57_14710 [Bordetella sp. N]
MQASTPRAPSTAADSKRIFYVRLLTAAIQAALLYALLRTAPGPDAIKNAWQTAQPQLYIPLLLAAVYAPLALLLGAGQMRVRPLILWTVLVALAAAGLGYHDALRGTVDGYSPGHALPAPWFRLWLILSAAGFVGHVLMTDRFGHERDTQRDTQLEPALAGVTTAAPPAGPLGAYARHFNTAWRIGLQLALAVVFLGVFWLVLYLGATLFRTIGLPAPYRIIQTLGFALPASTLAIAVAIHVTSIQASLIRGIRLLVLTLFSWLLPLMAAIVAAFLVGLLVQSVEPLWKTRYAGSLLLSSATLMVFLINACYQDGSPGQEGNRLRRWAAMLGAVELLPLVGLAIWALQLRVRQYGWSVDRIVAAAVCVMGAWYAIGYTASLIRPRGWMKRLEATNVSAAYLFLILVAALFSPVADPARLMVANQIARLNDGRADADKFDYPALYLDGGRWGVAALKDLSDNGSDIIKERAKKALVMYDRDRDYEYTYKEPDAAVLARTVDVLPAGRNLPDAFLKKEFWSQSLWGVPKCGEERQQGQARCTARFLDLKPGEPEFLLFVDGSIRLLFQPDAQGVWALVGNLEYANYCDNDRDRIERTNIDIQAVAPLLPDLMVGGDQRLRIIPRERSCPSTKARDAQ